jgi:hypothetical protein
LYWINSVYFIAMTCAHWGGFKYPLLFIYYDVPSTAYQDKIISFCAGTYAILYISAALNPLTVGPTAIIALFSTVLGLSAVNQSNDLRVVIGEGASTQAYWIQTALIAVLAGVLTAVQLGAAASESKKKLK